MGVKKLYTFLREHLDDFSHIQSFPRCKSLSSRRTRVLLDATATFISLAEWAKDNACQADGGSVSPLHHSDVDILGGDAFGVADTFRAFVRALQTLGFDVTFALDAPRGIDGKTSARDRVWDQRQLENQKCTCCHMQYAQGDRPCKVTPGIKSFVAPHLLTANILAVVQGLIRTDTEMHKVDVVVLDSEVDEMLGQLIHDRNVDLAITSDTDWIVTPLSIPIVLLQFMPWESLLCAKSDESADVALRVFEHQRLASALKVDSAELLLAATLCGNDIVPPKFNWTIDAACKYVRDSGAARDYAQDELVQSSIAFYKRAACWVEGGTPVSKTLQRIAVPTDASDELSVVARMEEVREFLRLYETGRIRSSYLPMLLHNAVFHALPPWTAAVGCTMPPLHRLPTMQRLEKTACGLMAAQRLRCRGEQQPNGDCSWFEIRQTDRAAKQSLCTELFGGSRTFQEAVLWIVHPVLYHCEIPLLATMMTVMALRKADKGAWERAYRALCAADRLDEHPSPRALELGHVMSTAYRVVAEFVELIGGGFDCIEPEHFYSGTLIHCLVSTEPREWYNALPTQVVEDVRKLADGAEKAIAGCTECRLLVGEPPIRTRLSKKWIGVFHRDELVDMLDEGVAVTTGSDGVLVQTKRQSPTSAESTQAANDTSAALPIMEHMPEILATIERSDVVCLQGETGCGKSSMIPLSLYREAQAAGRPGSHRFWARKLVARWGIALAEGPRSIATAAGRRYVS